MQTPGMVQKMNLDEFRDRLSEKFHSETVWLSLGLSFGETPKPDVCKEADMARLFSEAYSHIARYNRTAKEWYIYTGTHWEQDTGGCFAQELAKDFYKRLYKFMWGEWSKPIAEDDDEKAKKEQEKREAQQKAVGALHKLSRRKTLLEDARSVFPFSAEDLDTDPWVLNCQNVTVDLRTGECRAHNPEDLFSMVAGTEYDPAARAPRFERFIREIFSEPTLDGFQERPGLARFAQMALGYAMTGSVAEDCLFMLFGPATRNGKTTLMEAVMAVLGDYAAKSKPDTLAYTGKPNPNVANEDVARLKSKRFVSISEPNKTMHLDVAKVKDLTGGGTQTARFLHENSFQFQPEFKIFIDTNYRPRVTDETLFSSGRVHVLPFERHFPAEEQEKDLSEKLAAEKPGILNWLLEGLRMYLEAGRLEPCEESLEATKEYREDSDKIGQFWEERMEDMLHPQPGETQDEFDCRVSGREKNCKGGSVYREYCDWCADSNLHPQQKGLFFDDLRKRGLMQPCRIGNTMDKNGIKGWAVKEVWKEVSDRDAPPEWRN